MTIRLATSQDRDSIWTVLEPMIRRGDAYTLPRDIGKEQALEFWFASGNETFVWEEHGALLGTYFLRANQRGGGAHVANCGYVTACTAEGQGIARAMCLHSLERARERGFRAMQFNFGSVQTSAQSTSGRALVSKLSADCPARFCIPNRDTWMH